MIRMVILVTSDRSMLNSKNSSLGACVQWNRIDFSNSFSKTSALSIVPFQEKLNTLSLSSTLSANHSCNPAGVLKKSYKIEGEHRTGYSKVKSCFLVIYCSIESCYQTSRKSFLCLIQQFDQLPGY